jgi:hypothetical protein
MPRVFSPIVLYLMFHPINHKNHKNHRSDKNAIICINYRFPHQSLALNLRK